MREPSQLFFERYQAAGLIHQNVVRRICDPSVLAELYRLNSAKEIAMLALPDLTEATQRTFVTVLTPFCLRTDKVIAGLRSFAETITFQLLSAE